MSKNRSGKPIILFKTTLSYLTDPLYSSFIKELQPHARSAYFFCKDPETVAFNRGKIKKRTILETFDYYVEVSGTFERFQGTPRRALSKVWTLFRKAWLKVEKKLLLHVPFFWSYKRAIVTRLNQIDPAVILSGSDLLLSDLIIQDWAHARGVPFVVIQPSFIDPKPLPPMKGCVKHYWVLRSWLWRKIFHLPVYTRQRDWGYESPRNWLVLWSAFFAIEKHRDRLKYLGNPKLDPILATASVSTVSRGKIVICTDNIEAAYGPRVNALLMEFYQDFIRLYPDLVFVVKIHPREQIETYEALFPQKDFPNVEIVKDVDLYDLLRTSDVQISSFSTTSFEAVAMGIPIITVNPHQTMPVSDFFGGQINFHVTRKEQIPKALRTCLSDAYRARFTKLREDYLKKIVTYIDGSSARRYAEFLLSLIH